MSQSLASILVHLTFSTKHREPLIRDEIREDLHKYVAGIFKGVDSPALIVNAMPDHIHALFLLAKTRAPCDVIENVKTESSKWIKKQDSRSRGFYWQGGYGAFSVSQSQVDVVREYIQNQAEHHRVRTFQEEFRLLCERHGIELDERYAWD